MNRLALLMMIVLLLAGCRAETPEAARTTLPMQAAALDAPHLAPDSTTQRLFADVMATARAEGWHTRPFGEIMQAVGVHFLGTPYVGGKLDVPEEEMLIVDLTGFDCVLFVESVLALARGIAVEEYSYATFAGHLRDQRYRDGAMDGYCSRLHYFYDWIADNDRRGAVEDLTRQLGGEALGTRFAFMSEHRESYPRFATNDSLFQGIRAMEKRLADLETYYIPQDRIRAVYDRLRPGDIIATATDIDGLDVTHSGLVYAHPDGGIGFLHASTSGGVKVSPDLQDYVQNNARQIGIVVARPADPRERP